MAKEIKRVAVIGAGAMGSGIAAQVANAGYEVLLLDIREGAAAQAIERMKKANPATDPFNAGFMDVNNARLVVPGTVANDIEKIKHADLIIEAVFERLDVKEDTFRLIEKHARPDALITSNTSTITIDVLVEKMSPEFKARFMNTHFFNPPRFMRLLELIDGPETSKEAFAALRDFGDRVLGKKVVHCKDSPGFIANRIGVFLSAAAQFYATKQGVKIEDVDSLLAQPFGFSKLGIFKLGDAVGLDILQHVGKNLHDGLPATDEFNAIYQPDLVTKMVADGYTGKKGLGGFYRLNPETKAKEVIDLSTGEYRDVERSKYFKIRLEKKFGSYEKFFESGDPAAKFAWPVLRDALTYVLNHAEGMAYDIQSIDAAMRVGYNWKYGPFQLIDKIGVEWFTNKLTEEGIAVPSLLAAANKKSFYRVQDNQYQVMGFDGAFRQVAQDDGVLSLSDIKLGRKPLLSHASAKLWDIGDGVACFEFTSPQNAMDPSILYLLNESVKFIEGSGGKYKAMVIYNEGEKFSVGANLKLVEIFTKAANLRPFEALTPKAAPAFIKKTADVLDAAYMVAGGEALSYALNNKVDNFVQDLVYQGQAVYNALRMAPFPVIGAPRGEALGGGCEILLHCDAIQAGAESYIGLVEVGVGLIPAWGGCARYLERAQNAPEQLNGPMIAFKRAAMAIASPMESISSSGQDAKRKLWLRPDDGVTMNSDRILADAKAKALSMVPGYKPPAPVVYNLPGAVGKMAIRMNADALYFKADDPKKGVNHVDVAIVDRLSHVLSGGDPITAEDVATDVAQHQDAVREIIVKRPDGKVGVNASIPLTENRILQLEREAFMALFRTTESQDRISHMMNKGQPLREPRMDPAPDTHEIRAALEGDISLPARIVDGKPLTGKDGQRLADMADLTGRVYKVGKTFGLF